MKFFFKAKDGGPESKVHGYWLFESKKFGSIVLLRFEEGSREAYHTHAFNAISWLLRGSLLEMFKGGGTKTYTPSIKPILTGRECFHRVSGIAPVTWALSFRGPWVPRWKEYIPATEENITLSSGRVVVK